MLFFDDGNDTAGRDRPSGTGSAAVCAAAVRRTGDHGVSPVVSDAHCIGRWHFLCTGGPRGTVLGGVPDPCGERNGSVTIRFGNLAKPDFTYLHSGNAAERFPPAGGMGDWGLPQQARLSYKRYACVNAATGGVGISKVPIILLMRKSAMKCGRWRMRYRLTSPIRGSGCVFAPWERLCAVAA